MAFDIRKYLKGLSSSYRRERAIWTYLDNPMRRPRYIKFCLDICKACEHYKDEHCEICGCPISEDSEKLRWGTTRCPLPQPKWREEGYVRRQAVSLRDEMSTLEIIVPRGADRAQERIRKKERERPKKKGCGGCK